MAAGESRVPPSNTQSCARSSRVAGERDGNSDVVFLAVCYQVVEPDSLQDRHTHVVRVRSIDTRRPESMSFGSGLRDESMSFGSPKPLINVVWLSGRQGETLPRQNLENLECMHQ